MLGLPPVIPFTRQVTPGLVALVTAAVNCCVVPRNNCALVGEMLTITGLVCTGGGFDPPPPPPPPHAERHSNPAAARMERND